MNQQTLDQRRAAAAWKFVQQVEGMQERPRQKIGRQAKRMPVRIMASGLGQALAFVLSKGEADPLLEDISRWVLVERFKKNTHKAAEKSALLEAVISESPNFMRQATQETLAYLQWLNRFADAKDLTNGDGSDVD